MKSKGSPELFNGYSEVTYQFMKPFVKSFLFLRADIVYNWGHVSTLQNYYQECSDELI